MDVILGTEEELVPSSGFLATVMERVREEAVAPPPIPFPWKRALPGVIVSAGVFGWTALEFARWLGPAMGNMTLPPGHLPAAAARELEQAGWIVAAFAVSIASWLLCRRLAR
jgi:hypothetical protein